MVTYSWDKTIFWTSQFIFSIFIIQCSRIKCCKQTLTKQTSKDNLKDNEHIILNIDDKNYQTFNEINDRVINDSGETELTNFNESISDV